MTSETLKSNHYAQSTLALGLLVGLLSIGWLLYYFLKSDDDEQCPVITGTASPTHPDIRSTAIIHSPAGVKNFGFHTVYNSWSGIGVATGIRPSAAYAFHVNVFTETATLLTDSIVGGVNDDVTFMITSDFTGSAFLGVNFVTSEGNGVASRTFIWDVSEGKWIVTNLPAGSSGGENDILCTAFTRDSDDGSIYRLLRRYLSPTINIAEIQRYDATTMKWIEFNAVLAATGPKYTYDAFDSDVNAILVSENGIIYEFKRTGYSSWSDTGSSYVNVNRGEYNIVIPDPTETGTFLTSRWHTSDGTKPFQRYHARERFDPSALFLLQGETLPVGSTQSTAGGPISALPDASYSICTDPVSLSSGNYLLFTQSEDHWLGHQNAIPYLLESSVPANEITERFKPGIGELSSNKIGFFITHDGDLELWVHDR